MARNDAVLIDGIIDERVEQRVPSVDRGDAFELFAVEEILKDLDLTREEIFSGLVDGRGDGGLDAVYIVVNGHLLDDADEFHWPKSSAEIQLFLISCKHHDTFKQSTLDSMIATITELFDFTISDKDLKGAYSEILLSARSRLERAYRRLSSRLTGFVCGVVYASRGDTRSLGKEVVARAEQIRTVIAEQFTGSKVTFSFVGSEELLQLHRKRPSYALELPFKAHLSKGERYIVLVSLSDYFHFVTSEGKLRRYLFDSNVRDFMGRSRTNDDIRETLRSNGSPDFWWLNNGVTILATSASIVGSSIQIENVQIVNGLQTTESIYRHFNASGLEDDDRCVLIKIIVSNDGGTRDAIIRATNNQTTVEPASLHATDKIQRDIEDIFRNHSFVYERRKNYYVNDGVHGAKIITPLYLAGGSVALLRKQVWLAPKLKSKSIRKDSSYQIIFDASAPLEVWPAIATILKSIDVHLESIRPAGGGTDHFLKRRRNLVAFLIVARHSKTYAFGAKQIIVMSEKGVSLDEVTGIYEALVDAGYERKPTRKDIWSSRSEIIDFSSNFGVSHGISNVEILSSLGAALGQGPHLRRPHIPVTDEFVERVKLVLPAQPWKPGMQKDVCERLNCDPPSLTLAIDLLISRGELFFQRRGVLYDQKGEVVSIDTERVDPLTLELRSGE